MRSPTGDQYELVRLTPHGEARAVITQLAAALRELRIGEADLVQPYPESMPAPSAAGIVLAPWPNRVRDGKWSWRRADGTVIQQQLAITEPAYGNASHGLLRFTAYELVDKAADAVTLSATIYPQTGYPFLVDTRVRYALADDGITVMHELANGGETDAPVAVGAHPYLRVGAHDTATLRLTVNAATHIDVDDRKNPVGESPVEGTDLDLRAGRLVGELDLDDGFAQAGPGDLAWLEATDGSRTTLWGDESVRFVQAFTHRSFAALPAGQVAVALEPMTAPANAFNSGAGLKLLEPGETWSVTWGIRYAPSTALAG
ncbi:aldose 1-epimerase family protein [Gryllotalpicola ginsengisoli]|uniref:aldose 1-epimerase family protein n=1 Tax=Gryllotalpicola ginsengisoli TaxID=444608 RepID=UPI0003B50535|nr:aldose 1-epimerase family protein [Gryllotalpicola ginsengisoli]